MTHQELIADRIDLLTEVAAIERDVERAEQRGPVPDGADLRRRLATVRRLATAQVLGLLDALNESHAAIQ